LVFRAFLEGKKRKTIGRSGFERFNSAVFAKNRIFNAF
jgi:hypothetical protein